MVTCLHFKGLNRTARRKKKFCLATIRKTHFPLERLVPRSSKENEVAYDMKKNTKCNTYQSSKERYDHAIKQLRLHGGSSAGRLLEITSSKQTLRSD